MKDELEVKVAKAGNTMPTFALKQRMILNPDKDIAMKIIERIYKCGGKCPCQPQSDENDTRCPCPTFTVRGKCCCKLFVPAE